jgi:TolB-like protein
MTLVELNATAKAASIVLLMTAPASAGDKAAVLPFEIVRGIETATAEKHALEERRLATVTEELRLLIAGSGALEVVDSSSVAKKAASFNLQACGNCGDDLAREVGARYAVTGEVRKVSELIMSMHVYVRDAEKAVPVAIASVDLRGNTDESWKRAIDYLWQNVLSSRLKTAVQ